MAEMTSLQQATAIQERVEAVMKHYVLPQVHDDVRAAVQAQLVDAVRYVIGADLARYVREAVRAEITGRLKLSVEVTE